MKICMPVHLEQVARGHGMRFFQAAPRALRGELAPVAEVAAVPSLRARHCPQRVPALGEQNHHNNKQ
eukprot:8499298-Pyramimonas_sp.AAC.1